MHTLNKLDIVIRKKEIDNCLLMDVTVPSNYSIQKKTTEKMSKCVDLQTRCQRMVEYECRSSVYHNRYNGSG